MNFRRLIIYCKILPTQNAAQWKQCIKVTSKKKRVNSLVIAISNLTGFILQRVSIKMANFGKVLGLSLEICNAILKERIIKRNVTFYV